MREPEGCDALRVRDVNRISRVVVAALSLADLLDVVILGYTKPPLSDEGTGAHIFQLLIAAPVPAGLIFLTSADWAQPVRALRHLALPAAILVIAFAALYLLEH